MKSQIVLNNIKNKRKLLGITQKEMASKLYMDERTYSKIERGGKKTVDIAFISTIAELLQTDIATLLESPAEDWTGSNNWPVQESSLLASPPYTEDWQQALHSLKQNQDKMLAYIQEIREHLFHNSKDSESGV
jgi:transcriptional regulator with XRE-family HTH domain